MGVIQPASESKVTSGGTTSLAQGVFVRLQGGEDFGGVAGGFDFPPDFLDFAVRGNEENGTLAAHVILSVPALFDPDAIGRVRRNAEDDGVGAGEGRVRVAEFAGFGGAAGGVGFGVQAQDERGGLVKSKVTKRTRE